jgi:hypothetical protein
VRNYDPDGEAVETIIDIASIGFSAYDFYQEPSWENAGLLLADVGAALVPFVPAIGVIRHAGKLEKVADVFKGADKATDAAKAVRGAEKTGEAAKTIGKAEDAGQGIRFSGTRNPKISSAAMRGQAAHKAYNPGSGYIKEYRLPSGTRVDAIDFQNRTIRELKPDNPRAIEEGKRQLQGYIRELQKEFGGKWTGILDTYK